MLLEGSFLDRKENLLAFGNPGSGKSHLLCALAQELLVNGGRQMRFTTCALLVQELLIAKRELAAEPGDQTAGAVRRPAHRRPGLRATKPEEMEVLFTTAGGALRARQAC